MTYFHGGFPGLEPGDRIEPAPPYVEDGCPICQARAEGRIFTVGEFREWMATIKHPDARRALEMVKDLDPREPIDPPSKPNRVYITSHMDYARWYAARSRGDLYEVERGVRLDRRDRRRLMREWGKRDRLAKAGAA